MESKQKQPNRLASNLAKAGPALWKAAQCGNIRKCRRLLAAGVPANSVGGWQQLTALEVSARNSHLNVAALLIESGASVDQSDRWGVTPLVHAVRRGHTAMVALLLEHGASIDTTDRNGWSSLMWAASEGHPDVVAFLVEHGASVITVGCERRHYGTTPLHWGARRSCVACVKPLLAAMLPSSTAAELQGHFV